MEGEVDRISLSVSVNCTLYTHIKSKTLIIFLCAPRLGTFLHYSDGWKMLHQCAASFLYISCESYCRG